MTAKEASETSNRLVTKYGMEVPREIASSVFMGQPKVPVLLSRAAFRSNVDTRPDRKQRTQLQQERRKFLHTILGLAAVSITGVLLLKLAFPPTPQPIPPSQQLGSSSSQSNPSSNPQPITGQLLANGTNIPFNESLTFNDPTAGPIVLIHLDNGQFVAYSAICTHAGCQVQFDPSARDIACPCHGAVYDPYNNAQVVGGPAPSPLQKIPIQYDPSTGNIYLTG
jgi:thiosulfate dehydrogenase [quinone] large subunit